MKNEICPDWIWNMAKINYVGIMNKYKGEELLEKTRLFANFMCNNSAVKHPEYIEDCVKKCLEMVK